MTFDIQTIPDRYIYMQLLAHTDSFLFYKFSDLVISRGILPDLSWRIYDIIEDNLKHFSDSLSIAHEKITYED